MVLTIACIVEGQGEIEAVPLLVRRVATAIDPSVGISTPRPIRLPRSKLKRQGELERAVQFAALRAGPHGAVLLVQDADADCAPKLAPELLHQARAVSGGRAVSVVLAKWEFEAWFVAAAESLRGLRGLGADITAADDPEAIQGAKEWLSSSMQPGMSYRETRDQAALANAFDIDVARRAPSFDKFYREIERLLRDLAATAYP